jgi:hypothetical protein
MGGQNGRRGMRRGVIASGRIDRPTVRGSLAGCLPFLVEFPRKRNRRSSSGVPYDARCRFTAQASAPAGAAVCLPPAKPAARQGLSRPVNNRTLADKLSAVVLAACPTVNAKLAACPTRRWQSARLRTQSDCPSICPSVAEGDAAAAFPLSRRHSFLAPLYGPLCESRRSIWGKSARMIFLECRALFSSAQKNPENSPRGRNRGAGVFGFCLFSAGFSRVFLVARGENIANGPRRADGTFLR